MQQSILNVYAKRAAGSRINLAIGQLPGSPSRQIVEGLQRLVKDRQHAKYLPAGGSSQARSSVAEYFRRKGINGASADNCIIGNGAKELFMNALMSLRRRADNLIWFEPGYPVYKWAAEAAGLGTKAVFHGSPCFRPLGDFSQDLGRNGIVVLNNPVNPTGRVWKNVPGELGGVAKEAEERDLLVIADETYCDFVYDGEFTPFATLPGMAERTITINSGSKMLRAPAYRLGFATGPKWAIDGMETYAGYCTGCPNFAADFLAKHLLQLSREAKADLPWLDENRGVVNEWVRAHKRQSVEVTPMEGAYFAFLCMYSLCRPGLADELLRRGLGVIPGAAFFSEDKRGGSSQMYIRLSYAVEKQVLQEGLQIIADLLAEK